MADSAARPLAGRTALVTGASRGIGLACAELLHGAGARLVLLGRDVATLTKHIERRGQPGGAAFACDLAKPESLAGALRQVRDLHGVPDVIVNNAGQFQLVRADAMSPDDFARLVTVNLTSQFAIVREFLSDLRRQRRGHIVTIGSLADRAALPYNAAYAASKHGLRAMHEALREELRGSGVRTTLVSPEHVDTTLWDAATGELGDIVPRDRMLEAVDVADAVLYALTRAPEINVDELRLSRS